ncbi:MAG: DUF6265 family protein [Pseudomonadota bacterium]
MSASLAFGAPLAAKDGAETRAMPEGGESPPASVDALDWLVGQWEGKGVRGAPAMESWLKPMGGMMVGTFVQEDADGAIMFTEHMYLVQEDGSLALKLKHFNADLTGWEEKDDFLTFRLVALEECAAYFNALTLRCADRDKPGEGLVAAVRMKSGGELVFRFTRALSEISVPTCDPEITSSSTTCLAMALDASEALRAEILAIHQEMEVAIDALETSEKAFEAYREAECPASGDPEDILCRVRLTNQRIETLENTWLVRLQP